MKKKGLGSLEAFTIAVSIFVLGILLVLIAVKWDKEKEAALWQWQTPMPLPLAETTVEPSITIISNPPMSDGKVTINVEDAITITGKPLNLSGTMGEDYTRAFFFDPIFDGSLTNTDWELTGLAKKGGVSNFYIEIYKSGVTYRSNIIKVTVD